MNLQHRSDFPFLNLFEIPISFHQSTLFMDYKLNQMKETLEKSPAQTKVAIQKKKWIFDTQKPQKESVDKSALLPDLTLLAGEDLNAAHSHHRRRKLLSPCAAVVSIVQHNLWRQRAAQQHLIRCQKPLLRLQSNVVLVVQTIRRNRVKEHGGVRRRSGGVSFRRGAGSLQESREIRVQGGVGGRVEAAGEGSAVRNADGVSTGEGDHLVKREALDGEVVSERGGVQERRWQAKEGLVRGGDSAVAAARRDVIGYSAELPCAVAGGEGEDVGAGDGGRAEALELRFRGVDHFETS